MSEWFDAELHADRALEMYERGRWAEAESELRKALSLNPDQAEWHYNLGMTLEAAGRDLESLASYERTIELLPEQSEPLVAAAVVCNRIRRYERAIEWLDQALALAPASAMAHAHKIDALARQGRHDEAETAFYVAQYALPEPCPHCLAAIAESLIERRDFDRAGWCLRESLRLEPHLPRLRARLAAVLAATGRPQRALQMYLRDLRDDPGNIDTLLDYGELLIDLGRLPEASEKFRRVLELEPANVDAHFRLGQVAMVSGRYEQAHLEFELVLKLDRRFPLIRLSLAEALLKRGDLDTARQCLRDELDEWSQDGALDSSESSESDSPSSPAPRSERADRSASSAAFGDSPVEPMTRNVVDYERLGDLLVQAGMTAEGAVMFELAMDGGNDSRDRKCESPSLLRKLAIARFRSGDIAGGGAASRRVLRFDPNCVASIHNLALAALEAGQFRVAAGWVNRGLRVDRHDDGLRRLRMKTWLAWLRRCWRRG